MLFMTTAISFCRRFASQAAAAILGLGLGFANAEEISASHLQAARKAIAAIQATEQFDMFLPHTARELKNELMRKDPNLEKVISKTVDEQAFLLVPRRADLEKEVARVYAKHFTERELNDITNFYSSAAGKKLLQKGPEAMADSVGAYDIWRQGIAQDLAANVGKVLNETLNANASSGSIPASQLQKPGKK